MHYRIEYKHLSKALEFGVDILIEEIRDGRQQQNNLSYDLSIQPLTKAGWGAHGVRIQKTFLKNKANPADALVHRLAEPLLELDILLNGEGQPIKLHNHKAIWERWTRVQEEISRSYQGEWVEEKVSQTESLLLLPEAILEVAVKQDWVLGQYFAGIYSKDFDLYHHRCRTESRSYHFLGTHPILLREQWQYQPQPDGNNIQLEGVWQGSEADHNRLVQLAGSSATNLAVSVTKKGSYQLDQTTGWCRSYQCTYALSIGETYQKQVTLKAVPL